MSGLNTTLDGDRLICHDDCGLEFVVFAEDFTRERDRLWIAYKDAPLCLDRTQAAELAKILTHFADTGEVTTPESQHGKAQELTIEEAPREIIGEQLLMALDDKSKVALVFSKEDLDELIDALHRAKFHTKAGVTKRQATMLEDLHDLRDAAFPEGEEE